MRDLLIQVLMSFVEPKNEGVSLAYEHDAEYIKPDNTIIERIQKVMANLISQDSGAKRESAHEFTHLVSLLRKVDKKRMIPVMEEYLDCEKSGKCRSADSDLKNVYRQVFFWYHHYVPLWHRYKGVLGLENKYLQGPCRSSLEGSCASSLPSSSYCCVI